MLYNALFNIQDRESIQVTVQTSSQYLARAVYISCTILANKCTSIYSHQIALIKDNVLHFQEDKLPSLNLSQLIHPDIDKVTGFIEKSDLLAEVFYPVYSGEKISLQCLNPQFVVINDKKYIVLL